VDAASEARVMDFFVVGVGLVFTGVGLVLCACMAAVSGAIAEFAAASADGYDAAVSAVRSHLQEGGQEEKAAQPPA
jgi:uncharacterized membrane protein